MAKDITPKTEVKDITRMTEQEIKDYLTQMKVEKVKRIQEKGVTARAELEKYCQEKYQMSLADIFTATKKKAETKSYRNPETRNLYIYSGRGKLPKWCTPENAVLANGS